MSGRPLDPVALAAGVAAVVAGALLALQQGGTIELSAGWIGAIACAAIGAVLVVSGVAAREE